MSVLGDIAFMSIAFAEQKAAIHGVVRSTPDRLQSGTSPLLALPSLPFPIMLDRQ